MIEIQGLNAKQRILADLIWGMDSKESVDNFVRTLPEKDAVDAKIVIQMMLWAFLDEIETVEESTKKLVDSYK